MPLNSFKLMGRIKTEVPVAPQNALYPWLESSQVQNRGTSGPTKIALKPVHHKCTIGVPVMLRETVTPKDTMALVPSKVTKYGSHLVLGMIF